MSSDEQSRRLAEAPIVPLMLSLAMPCIASQLINLLYNIVDRVYIGHIAEVGRIALTGVGVCMPLIMFISAFAALVSMGAAPRASIFLGKGDLENAQKCLGNSVTMLMISALLLTVVFQLFAEPLLLVFGASENTLPYASTYMRIYSLGTLFVQMTLGLNVFVSSQGFARTSMLTVLIGAVTNIVLDPILIFGLNLGVTGAAIATIFSQAVSTVWILCFLTGKKTILRIQRKNLALSKEIVLPSLALGLAPFIMQATESLLSFCFNTSLQRYGGDLAVGAMTILSSVQQFSMLPLVGLTQGAQPILSFNYGSANLERVKKAFRLLLGCCFGFSFLLWLTVMLFPQIFVLIFNSDPTLLAFASHALRLYLAASLLMGVQLACQQSFIALGNSKSAVFVALLRKIILLIPLIYLLPQFLSDRTTAVFLAEPLADSVSAVTSFLLFLTQFRKILKNASA